METPELPQVEIPNLKPKKEVNKKKWLFSSLVGFGLIKNETIRSLVILGLTLTASAAAGFLGPDIYRMLTGGTGRKEAKALKSAGPAGAKAPLNYSGGEFGSYGVDGLRAAGAGSLGIVGAANVGKLAENQNPYGQYEPPEEEDSGEDELKPTPKASGEDFLAKNLKALQKDMKELKDMQSGVGAAGSGGGSSMPLPIEGMEQGSKKSELSGFSIAGEKKKPGSSGKRALVGGQGSALGQLFSAKTAAQTSYKAGEGGGSLDSFFESGGVRASDLAEEEEGVEIASRNLESSIRKETGRITRCSKISDQLQPQLQNEQQGYQKKKSWTQSKCGGFFDTMGCAFGGNRCRTCSRMRREMYQHQFNAAVLNCKIWRACEKDTDNQLRASSGGGCNMNALMNKFNLGSSCPAVNRRCLE